ncbi:MAG: 50S ribosomal protein L25 [Planctomycetes bacterium]|nr:50S ribosomal protein L25 [Planctomycetota bacterium]
MTANLKTTLRVRLGSRPSRLLRRQGLIPVSLHGEGKEALLLTIDEHEFLTARRRHEHVFMLDMEGGRSDSVMVRELQWDPLGEAIVHVEFRRVDLTRETEAQVPLEFVGHPKGGVLNHLVALVTVAAIPSKIPDSIEVKVDAMELGHPLFARDLKLPEGVRLVTPGNVSIAVVVIVKEEVAAPVAAAVPAEGETAAAAAAPGAAAPAADKAGATPGKGAAPAKPAAPAKGGGKKD